MLSLPERHSRVAALVLLLVIVALVWVPASRHVRAARLLVRFENADISSGDVPGGDVRVQDTNLAGLRARRYATSSPGPPVLLLPGVHPAGIDEPRLVRFAHVLAESGYTVFATELPSFVALQLDPEAVGQIGAAARTLAQQERTTAVGVIGISFGGGLALVAAATPEHRDAIGAIWAIGPHHDVGRLVRWWAGGDIEGPDGERPPVPPARYGVQIAAHAYAEEYFGTDAPEARSALRALIEGDTDRAEALAAALPPAARDRWNRLRQGHDLAPVASRLDAVVRNRSEELTALSPAGRLGAIRAPVYLLHGRNDPVVASTESLWIARELPPDRLGGVVRTELIGHADRNPASRLAHKWAVVHLVAGVIAALDK